MDATLARAAEPLLQPQRLFAADVLAGDPKLVPAEPGVYGWWFDDAIRELPTAGAVSREGRSLLYVGIAPNGASRTTGARTLRHRLKDHCRGPVANSTLRRTLLALLGSQQGWTPQRQPNGKLFLAAEAEAALTRWMAEHLRVAWMVHPEPWQLEHALITAGPRLPLNIAGSADPFVATLKRLRLELGQP